LQFKDYDADERPAQWAKRWNIQNWGLVSAWDHATRIGGAVIAFDTPGVSMLEGRRDLVVLWDIRVAPAWRRSGVGSMLFDAATSWARARGCSRLDVETQNINVPACRFYARMGCTLRRVDRFAYADLPDEVQLLWSRQLT
jgi:GNAT superfamily N-acetyltransferase